MPRNSVGFPRRKTSNKKFKKRCEYPGCKKLAREEVEGGYYCKKHFKRWM
jgi:hypothetical protein